MDHTRLPVTIHITHIHAVRGAIFHKGAVMRPGDPTFSIEAEIKHKSTKALLVQFFEANGTHSVAQWIPLSQVADGSDLDAQSKIGDTGTLTMSEWIAGEKGLL